MFAKMRLRSGTLPKHWDVDHHSLTMEVSDANLSSHVHEVLERGITYLRGILQAGTNTALRAEPGRLETLT
jgi:hypothetical protein